MSLATLLVLADGRLPSGGHAHSGGLEAQVAGGRVRGPPRRRPERAADRFPGASAAAAFRALRPL
ncbi:MAG TPA: hypothetical protein VFW27_14175, partial [Actinoplanes sp.]|nr:hypothetical protein [Actinoplanes sp.]